MNQIDRRTMLLAGLGLLAGATTVHAAPPRRRAGLVLVTGNSHSIGWTAALPADRFSDKILEFTQAGRVAAVEGTILDAGDMNPAFGRASLGPSLSFLNGLATAREDLERIVAVATGKGSTGFVDGVWSARPPLRPGNLLARAIRRWNAARQALIDQGYEVVPICAVHMSARPDADISDPGEITRKASIYAAEVDAYVDRVRAELGGVDQTFPVIVSCAITRRQMEILGSDLVCFASAGNGVAWRRSSTWFVDPVNDWGDGEEGHLPVVPFDGAHADRDGALTEGRLLLAALARARENQAPHAPFSQLDSYASLESLYDFRSGSALDMTGRAHLLQATSAPGVIAYTSAFETFAFKGTGGENRSFRRQFPLPPLCTLALRLAIGGETAGRTLLTGPSEGTATLTVAIDGRSRLSVRWGGATVETPLPRQDGRPLLLALRRDGRSLQVFIDGNLVGDARLTADKVIDSLVIGGEFSGTIQFLAIFSSALRSDQLASLAEASYTGS